ncbi:hypothetical protein DK846_04345 [Methanospirillum lacunae]|uniref:Uncharacterized protein n=2 Tax=Methanospirillum lacunae TaxID=668570 RepID=A0A2V2N795_9EURY|nr:hypothetical protein DK846_04345 [Methanospirillum lacunae]
MFIMKLLSGILVLLCAVFLLICPVLAIDYTGWKEVSVNEAPINSTSSTVYSLKIPPGNSIRMDDTPIGPITNVFNPSDSRSRVSIVISNNQAGHILDPAASRQYLDKFMLGAKISQIYGDQPQFLNNGGVMVYGTSGDKTLGIYIMSTDKKVITVTGFYKSLQDAKAGVDILGMIAGSIQMAIPISK